MTAGTIPTNPPGGAQHERRPNRNRAAKITGEIEACNAAWRTGAIPEGGGYSVKIMSQLDAMGLFACSEVLEGAMDMADAFEVSIEKAEGARARLNAQLKEFRGEIKNDLAAISASGDRVRDEVRKIALAIESVVQKMSGRDVAAAVENMERLAAALAQIEKLSSTKLMFAVIDQKSQDSRNP